jgi:hypothetical protein
MMTRYEAEYVFYVYLSKKEKIALYDKVTSDSNELSDKKRKKATETAVLNHIQKHYRIENYFSNLNN